MEASIDSVNSERDAFLLKLRFISGEIRFTVNSDAFVSRALAPGERKRERKPGWRIFGTGFYGKIRFQDLIMLG